MMGMSAVGPLFSLALPQPSRMAQQHHAASTGTGPSRKPCMRTHSLVGNVAVLSWDGHSYDLVTNMTATLTSRLNGPTRPFVAFPECGTRALKP